MAYRRLNIVNDLDKLCLDCHLPRGCAPGAANCPIVLAIRAKHGKKQTPPTPAQPLPQQVAA